MTTDVLADQLAVRADLCEQLRRNVFGPDRDSTEELTDPPLDRYLTGILYPRVEGEPVVLDDQVSEDAPDDDAIAGADPAVSLSNVQYPSSAGITFAVLPDAQTLDAVCWAARYVPEEKGDQGVVWTRATGRATEIND